MMSTPENNDQNRTAPLLYLGTAQGLHILRGDSQRHTWTEIDWTLPAYDISALCCIPTGPILAGTADGQLLASFDLGKTWDTRVAPFAGHKIWTIVPDPVAEGVYVGVDGGHLFYSADHGITCRELSGLRELRTVPYWSGPFGTSIFHSVLPVVQEPGRVYAALSVVGVLVSTDSGQTWYDSTGEIPRIPTEHADEPALADVHKLVLHPHDPQRLYATTHMGMYRSDDGAQTWHDISAGLPFAMTRPVVLHPHDPDTVFVIAHEDAPDSELPIIHGPLLVNRSRDGGRTWHALNTGLPEKAECAVLREAFVTDFADPPGLYLGTNRGQVFVSTDDGDTWQPVTQVTASIRVIRLQL